MGPFMHAEAVDCLHNFVPNLDVAERSEIDYRDGIPVSDECLRLAPSLPMGRVNLSRSVRQDCDAVALDEFGDAIRK
jgi:hypothetical protein